MNNKWGLLMTVVLFAASSAASAQVKSSSLAVSDNCSKFVTKMSSSFDIKHMGKPGAEYQPYKIVLLPSAAKTVGSDDYSIELVCRKPDPSFTNSFELLTASIDYNGTQQFHSKMSDVAFKEFAKIVANAGFASESEGQRKLARCFAEANKSQTKPTMRTSRYDAGFDDGNGSEFSCFRITYANSSSYGIAINLGFNLSKAILQK